MEKSPTDEVKDQSLDLVRSHTDIRFGSMVLASPQEVIQRATDIAKALADVIRQRQLFVTISGKEYVKVEGWTTLAAMLGVVPLEDGAEVLPDRSVVASVLLKRASDGMIIGRASASCSPEEKKWSKADDYAIRSMAITRATSKSCRLSLSWVMNLAGYESTPFEEMDSVIEGTATVVEDKPKSPSVRVPTCNKHNKPMAWDKDRWRCTIHECPAISYAPGPGWSPEASGGYWGLIDHAAKLNTDLTPAMVESNFVGVMIGEDVAGELRLRTMNEPGLEILHSYLYYMEGDADPPSKAGKRKDAKKVVGQATSRLAFEQKYISFDEALDLVEGWVQDGKWVVAERSIEGQKAKRLVCGPVEDPA